MPGGFDRRFAAANVATREEFFSLFGAFRRRRKKKLTPRLLDPFARQTRPPLIRGCESTGARSPTSPRTHAVHHTLAMIGPTATAARDAARVAARDSGNLRASPFETVRDHRRQKRRRVCFRVVFARAAGLTTTLRSLPASSRGLASQRTQVRRARALVAIACVSSRATP